MKPSIQLPLLGDVSRELTLRCVDVLPLSANARHDLLAGRLDFSTGELYVPASSNRHKNCVRQLGSFLRS
jgi:hypothetical protein